MTIIFISIVCMAVVGMFFIAFSDNGYKFQHGLASFLGFILLILSAVGFVLFTFTSWSWFSAEYKAEIINREYGTNYTQEEVFWASNVIDTVRELDRKRIELNGNIMQEQVND